MMKMLLSLKGVAFMSVFPILFFGLTLMNHPQSNKAKKTEVMNTYLIKIPNSAGVCPYELMQSSNGRLQMYNDPHCVCPYEQNHNSSFNNAVYMTANCPDMNSVIELLPASIQNLVEIKLLSESGTLNKIPKLYTSLNK